VTLSSLLNRDCVVLHRVDSGEDEYGNPISEDTELATVCELQQRRSEEPGAVGERAVTDWVIFLPAGTPIATADAVTVDEHRLEVIGDPWEVRNPRTRHDSHVELVARTAG